MDKKYLWTIEGMLSMLFGGVVAFFVLSFIPIYGYAQDVAVVFSQPVPEVYANHVTGNVALIMDHAAFEKPSFFSYQKMHVTRIPQTGAVRVTSYGTVAQHAAKQYRALFARAQHELAQVYAPSMGIGLQKIGTPYKVIRWPLIVSWSGVALVLGWVIAHALLRTMREWSALHLSKKQTFAQNKTMVDDYSVYDNKRFAPSVPQASQAYTWSDVLNELEQNVQNKEQKKNTTHDTEYTDPLPETQKEEVRTESAVEEEMPSPATHLPDVTHDTESHKEIMPETIPQPQKSKERATETTLDSEQDIKIVTTGASSGGSAPQNLPTVSGNAVQTQSQKEPQKNPVHNEDGISGETYPIVDEHDLDLDDIGSDIEPTDEELKERLNQLLQGKL